MNDFHLGGNIHLLSPYNFGGPERTPVCLPLYLSFSLFIQLNFYLSTIYETFLTYYWTLMSHTIPLRHLSRFLDIGFLEMSNKFIQDPCWTPDSWHDPSPFWLWTGNLPNLRVSHVRGSVHQFWRTYSHHLSVPSYWTVSDLHVLPKDLHHRVRHRISYFSSTGLKKKNFFPLPLFHNILLRFRTRFLYFYSFSFYQSGSDPSPLRNPVTPTHRVTSSYRID